MEALLQGIEVEALATHDDDLAVDDRTGRQALEQGFSQLREVAVQGLEVPALDGDLAGLRTEDDGAKAVPLGLEEEVAHCGQRGDRLGEHGLDRRGEQRLA